MSKVINYSKWDHIEVSLNFKLTDIMWVKTTVMTRFSFKFIFFSLKNEILLCIYLPGWKQGPISDFFPPLHSLTL